MNYHWNWGIFWEISPDGAHSYLQTLLLGTAWTLATAISAWCIALVFGSIIGAIRTTPNACWCGSVTPMSSCSAIFALVQMFLWYFVLPEVVPQELGTWLKQAPNASFIPPVWRSVSTLARRRAGARRHLKPCAGPAAAALALGLTLPQAYGFVLLPMAYRIMLPPLTSELLNIIKNSSVALTIGLMELTARARAMQEFSFQVFEAFTAATVIYIVINIVVTFAMRALERRAAVPGFIGPSLAPAH